MNITHAKVSGQPNPADVTKIGGEDWDEPHVFHGLRLLGSFRVERDAANSVTFLDVVGINTPGIIGTGVGGISFSIPEIGSESTLNRIVIQVPDSYNQSLQRLQSFRVQGPEGGVPGFGLKFELINTSTLASSSFGMQFWAVVNIYEVV